MDSKKFACSISLFLLVTMSVLTAKVISSGTHVATATAAKSTRARKIGVETVAHEVPFSRKVDKFSNGKYNVDDDVSHLPHEVDEAGYLAFSADYRAPRHHPPKNN